jgi:hypothetical protein
MNRAIGDAIKARLAALTFTPAIPVGWPNRDFTPPNGRYMVAAFVKAPNERLTLGAGTRFSGSLVINIATPGNAGTGEGESLADAVAAHFPANLSLSIAGGGSVRITTAPIVRDGYLDAGMWRTPVVIPFAVMIA